MKISRKEFLRYGSLIVVSPIILFNSISCNDLKTPVEERTTLAKDGFPV